MTIQEKINADLRQAMLQKDETTKSLLRVVIGEFNRVDKVLSDEKATSILKKMVENAKEVGNENEVAILQNYLPKQLSKDQLMGVISSIIEDYGYTSMKDMGKIMASLKETHAGQYDGKLASEIIKNRLA